MHRPFVFASLALFLSQAAAFEGNLRPEPELIPNAFVVELRDPISLGRRSDEHTHVAFKRALSSLTSYDVRYEYTNHELFYGISMNVHNNESLAALKSLPEVVNVSPVQFIPRPLLAIDYESRLESSSSMHTSRKLAKRQQIPENNLDYNVPHTMTGVDRVHAAGIKGKGVKIAVLDSGVDYYHPALGGCFGPGCKISFGYDLVGDEYDGYSTPVEDADPLAACVGGGHGSHVSGIIAMESSSNDTFKGMVGVAPEATLGMYRVFGCSGGVGSDVLVAAMMRAASDGAQIISMSIGGFSSVGNSPNDPYHVLIQKLTDSGIAVVAAAGNDGANLPFAVNAPANSPAAIAVGSIENNLFQTFEMIDSNGEVIRYGSLYPFSLNRTLTAVHVGDGGVQGNFGCRAADYDAIASKVTGSKDNYVIVVRRGLCGLTLIQDVAATAGFNNILTYPDKDVLDNPFLEGFSATLPNAAHNFGTTTNNKIQVGSLKGGYSVTFRTAVPQLTRQAWGGQMNNFSSPGPVWDFSLKPQISAPGGQILSTWPLAASGWALASGTSMATPYLSGVLALVKSRFPELSVTEILNRLQSTSKPTTRATRDDVSPPVHQGAGLVDAYNAIFYPSFISPGQFDLGPNEVVARSSYSINIVNPSDKATQYTLSHTPAPGMARYPNPDVPDQVGFFSNVYQRLASLPFAATINFPEGSIVTLGPGESKTISVEIIPPQNLRAFMIPFYSGFISISSNRNEKLSIPYQGAGYNYTAAPSLGTDPVPPNVLIPVTEYPVFGAPQLVTSDGFGIQDYIKIDPAELTLYYAGMQPVRIERLDVVRADTDFKPTWYGFNQNKPLNYTKTAQPVNGTVAGAELLGNLYVNYNNAPVTSLFDSWPVPRLWDVETASVPIPMLKGGYRLLISHLKYGADETKPEDWSTWMSGVIDVPEDYYP
ncbi:peptidase [Colletotrichum simmondsii]|uniref:Peptidase n=1 Tax=Colletotrichum simmondsii TaxID=703756 RepID=A0A135SKQ0_9PEZI|nr:peptidase [Colletotrichum simmondsii]